MWWEMPVEENQAAWKQGDTAESHVGVTITIAYQKKTLVGRELLLQRQSVSLHTWRRQGPRKPSSCATFTPSSHRGRATTGKKVLHLYVQGLQSCLTLCDPVDCGLPGFSVGGSPGKNTGA